MLKPVLALVGRPNVGKSTLFNGLTKSREALVADFSGLTRDRKYGEGCFDDQFFIVIDTGGLSGEVEGIDSFMARQSKAAVAEADAVLFLVDGRAGVNSIDQQIAEDLRALDKPVFLVVNKTDGLNPDVVLGDFYSLGLGEPYAIAAVHRRGVSQLIESVLAKISGQDSTAQVMENDSVGESVAEGVPEGIKVAVIGRPNVGKSTLVNRMLGEDRVVVFDMPGTTRDSIYIPYERRGENYTLIDTAGVRRRGKIQETVEKFSIIKTLKAMQDAHVVILVIDAQEGIVDQDLHLLSFALDAGCSLIIAVNKWDGLMPDVKQSIKRALDRRLEFISYAKIHFISALHGTGVGELYPSLHKAYEGASKRLSTNFLTRILERAVKDHPPPLVRGRRIKLRFAHMGGVNPPKIVIHGNQTDEVPAAYSRYLENTYRRVMKLVGTPVRIEFRKSENPFAGRRNKLSQRQVTKKRRLMAHVKKQKRKKKT